MGSVVHWQIGANGVISSVLPLQLLTQVGVCLCVVCASDYRVGMCEGWLVITPCAGFAPLLALQMCGLKVAGLLAFETDQTCDLLLDDRYEAQTDFHYKNLGDIRKVDLSAEIDAFISEVSVDPYRVLVLYGAPCQGYCMVNAERGEAMSPEHIVNLHCKICLDAVKKRFLHGVTCM